MIKCGIDELEFHQTNGNCSALITDSDLWSSTQRKLLTINWHVEARCNYECDFCFAHFDDVNQEEITLDALRRKKVRRMERARAQKERLIGTKYEHRIQEQADLNDQLKDEVKPIFRRQLSQEEGL